MPETTGHLWACCGFPTMYHQNGIVHYGLFLLPAALMLSSPNLCLHIWYSCYIQRVKTPTSPNWIPHTGESSLLVSSVAGKRAPRVQPLTFEYKVILGYRYQRSPSLNLFSLSSFGKLTSAGVLLVQAKHIVLLGIEKVMWMKFDFKIPPVPGP